MTGKPFASHAWPTDVARALILSSSVPGTPIPERSPLMSAAKTGTPFAESCSASSCKVLVLPVPVAPATSPCRLSMPSGILMWTSDRSVASSIRPPSSNAGPVNAYPGATAAAMGLSGTGEM